MNISSFSSSGPCSSGERKKKGHSKLEPFGDVQDRCRELRPLLPSCNCSTHANAMMSCKCTSVADTTPHIWGTALVVPTIVMMRSSQSRTVSVTSNTASNTRGTSGSMSLCNLLMIAAKRLRTSASLHIGSEWVGDSISNCAKAGILSRKGMRNVASHRKWRSIAAGSLGR